MVAIVRVELYNDDLMVFRDDGKKYRGVRDGNGHWLFAPIPLVPEEPTDPPAPDPGTGEGDTGTWQWPFQYSRWVITTGPIAPLAQYGMRDNPVTGKHTMHWGLDFGRGGIAGQPIPAAAAGRVVEANYNAAMGNHVVIDHPGNMRTRYFHMVRTPSVTAGQQVTKGQTLGNVGSTGNSTGAHLHWETYENGVHFNPREFMKRRGVPEN